MEKSSSKILKVSGLLLLSLFFIAGCKKDENNSQPKNAYVTNIIKQARDNNNFRKVLFTGTKSQLVVMSIKPGESIGEETHKNVEQIIFIQSGSATLVLNDEARPFEAGDVVVIPPGTKHNIINSGKNALKICTVYVPPNHIDGTIHRTKKDAEQDVADENFAKKVE
jgi:mannose-6-phosphate isomerase-like protein (cupin superfamily)